MRLNWNFYIRGMVGLISVDLGLDLCPTVIVCDLYGKKNVVVSKIDIMGMDGFFRYEPRVRPPFI